MFAIRGLGGQLSMYFEIDAFLGATRSVNLYETGLSAILEEVTIYLDDIETLASQNQPSATAFLSSYLNPSQDAASHGHLIQLYPSAPLAAVENLRGISDASTDRYYSFVVHDAQPLFVSGFTSFNPATGNAVFATGRKIPLRLPQALIDGAGIDARKFELNLQGLGLSKLVIPRSAVTSLNVSLNRLVELNLDDCFDLKSIDMTGNFLSNAGLHIENIGRSTADYELDDFTDTHLIETFIADRNQFTTAPFVQSPFNSAFSYSARHNQISGVVSFAASWNVPRELDVSFNQISALSFTSNRRPQRLNAAHNNITTFNFGDDLSAGPWVNIHSISVQDSIATAVKGLNVGPEIVAGSTVEISGATPPAYNGRHLVMETTFMGNFTQFTFRLSGSPAPAGGAIIARRIYESVAYNQLSELDLSHNALTECTPPGHLAPYTWRLDVSHNALTSLNVQALTELIELNCSNQAGPGLGTNIVLNADSVEPVEYNSGEEFSPWTEGYANHESPYIGHRGIRRFYGASSGLTANPFQQGTTNFVNHRALTVLDLSYNPLTKVGLQIEGVVQDTCDGFGGGEEIRPLAYRRNRDTGEIGFTPPAGTFPPEVGDLIFFTDFGNNLGVDTSNPYSNLDSRPWVDGLPTVMGFDPNGKYSGAGRKADSVGEAQFEWEAQRSDNTHGWRLRVIAYVPNYNGTPDDYERFYPETVLTIRQFTGTGRQPFPYVGSVGFMPTAVAPWDYAWAPVTVYGTTYGRAGLTVSEWTPSSESAKTRLGNRTAWLVHSAPLGLDAASGTEHRVTITADPNLMLSPTGQLTGFGMFTHSTSPFNRVRVLLYKARDHRLATRLRELKLVGCPNLQEIDFRGMPMLRAVDLTGSAPTIVNTRLTASRGSFSLPHATNVMGTFRLIGGAWLENTDLASKPLWLERLQISAPFATRNWASNFTTSGALNLSGRGFSFMDGLRVENAGLTTVTFRRGDWDFGLWSVSGVSLRNNLIGSNTSGVSFLLSQLQDLGPTFPGDPKTIDLTGNPGATGSAYATSKAGAEAKGWQVIP